MKAQYTSFDTNKRILISRSSCRNLVFLSKEDGLFVYFGNLP